MEFCFDKIKWGLPFTFAVGVFTQAFGQEQRPNLVYIFADQYRLNALSLWSNPAYRNVLSTVGDPVHTPNLDRLAKQGVVFSRACSTCPLSSPHRAMLMTGMFPEKNGVDTNCFKGKNLYNLQEGKIINSFQGLLDNLDKLTYSSYICELIDICAEEGEVNGNLLRRSAERSRIDYGDSHGQYQETRIDAETTF